MVCKPDVFQIVCGWGHRVREVMSSNEAITHTFGANAHLVLSVVLQETLDTTAGKL